METNGVETQWCGKPRVWKTNGVENQISLLRKFYEEISDFPVFSNHYCVSLSDQKVVKTRGEIQDYYPSEWGVPMLSECPLNQLQTFTQGNSGNHSFDHL